MSIINDLNNHFEPKMLLTVFCDKTHRHYIEVQDVIDGLAQASRPLSEGCLSELVTYFADERREEDTIKGFVPQNVLYCEWGLRVKMLVWYNEPMTRQMYFTNDLKIPSGLAMQPTLIYMVRNGNLFVFAAKTKRVSSGTKLYVPPYHNCSLDGSVCIGSAKIKKPKETTYLQIIEHWEKLFWNSEFSHLATGEMQAHVNINLYWKQAIKNQLPFDNSILVPKNMDLFHFLTKISRNA